MLKYKGWFIQHNPKPIPIRAHDWDAFAEDYDGAPDAEDGRSLTCSSLAEAKAEIDNWISENELFRRSFKC